MASVSHEGKKRTLFEAIASDEPTLWLELADGGERIPAHRELLSLACSCVKGLPPGDRWCLRELTVEGRPVSRAVVVAWIKAVYAVSPASYDCDDGDSDISDDRDSDSGEDGIGRGTKRADAFSLLLFADAVGSSSRVMRECYKNCSEQFDSICVKTGGERVELQLDGRGYNDYCNKLVEATMTVDREIPLSASAAAAVHELGPKAAAQLEPMLHLAYRLGLHDLQEKLHAAILGNAAFGRSLFFGGSIFKEHIVPSILTARVMAAVPKDALRNAWWEHISRKACPLSGAIGPMKVEGTKIIATHLQLNAPLLGTPAGTKLRVKVDLERGTIEREANKAKSVKCRLMVGDV